MPLIVEDIKLYSVKELSELLSVTKAAVLRYINTGRLKAQMIGGKWMVASDNLKEFLTASDEKAEDKKRVSLEGMFSDGSITDEDTKKAKAVWEAKTLR
jgi:excisionase family DNA binding protein